MVKLGNQGRKRLRLFITAYSSDISEFACRKYGERSGKETLCCKLPALMKFDPELAISV
jgi:hypothetical protein